MGYISSLWSSVILSWFLIVPISSSTMLNVTTASSERVAAVFAFGDSLLDTGNNNYITGLVKCNFPPYGVDFPGGPNPTGRCSNGKLISDLIAEELGIKQYLPPYLDPNLSVEDLVTGVCFASAGSGYDPETLKITLAISIPNQLKLFEQYMARLRGLVGEQRSTYIVKESLYLISSGNNDILVTYSIIKHNKYDMASYATFLVTQYIITLKQLYELGARKIVVMSASPVGCVPVIRTVIGGMTRRTSCVESCNEVVQLFNAKLSWEIGTLNANLYGARIQLADIFTPAVDIIRNPGEYGFVNVGEGCCGTGLIEASILCNKMSPFTCKNTFGFVFWDSVHPTERVYRFLLPRPAILEFIQT
ncbi:GDSL esterase/lipase At5g42170 [Linum grandiflorum]